VSKNRSDRNRIFSESQEQQGIQRRNILEDDFGWEVPVESVPIPSQGKLYPPSSPMFGKERVNIKAMTAREEDILTSRALMVNGTVIEKLIESCVLDHDVNVNEMLTGDRSALMVAVRITGYGPNYTIKSNCPKCIRTDSYTFNLADLPIKRLKLDPVSPGENRFEFKLPVSKKIVHFKFLTGKDNDLIEAESKKMAELFPEDVVGSAVTRRLKFSILSIDGITDRNKLSRFIENMPAMDSKTLRTYIKKNEPGIEMVGRMTCNFCSKVSEVSLPLGASFFWPEL
tara:strand:+ start:1065 stop:1919 length:855 start_codon:yes stop_codon:yes gene_type:complete